MSDADKNELVTVMASSGPADLAMAESLLRSSGISYVKSGEALQGLFGMGALGGFDVLAGPVAIQVAEADAETARELLSALTEDGPGLDAESHPA